jgi:hypothetical protein
VDPGQRWMRHMRRGDFAAAWAVSDALLRARANTPCWHLPRHEQYVWDGTPLRGRRVVVLCYHGFGDTLQFIRYVPRIDAAEITVVAQPSLIPLLETSCANARFVALTDDGLPRRDDDVHVEVMELAHVFRSTLDTLPSDVPYLSCGVTPSPRNGSLSRVGVVCRGGDWDPRRDVPETLMATLGDVPGVTLVSLGDVAPPLRLAQTMCTLDLVVTIDSMPAHLAGALGIPVWTLLHSDADWRWMDARDDSPWYPTMRLFRQERAGEWAPVVARVRDGLSMFAGSNVTAALLPRVPNA